MECPVDERQWQRLHWRCRRGMLELDLLLQGYRERHRAGLTLEELAIFERLLTLPDQTLLDYFQGKQIPPEKDFQTLVAKIRQ